MTSFFPTSPSSLSSRQFLSGSGVVDASGNCEIIVPTPPVGQFYTGTITVFDSPLAIDVNWMVKVNNFTTDVASNRSSVGNLQIGHGDTFSLVTGGLQAYIGQTFHATYVVIASPADNTNLIVPGHDAYSFGYNHAGLILKQTAPQGITIQPTSTVASSFHGLMITSVATLATQGSLTQIKVQDSNGQVMWYCGEIAGGKPIFVPFNSEISPNIILSAVVPLGAGDVIEVVGISDYVPIPIGMPMHAAATQASGVVNLAVPLSILGVTSSIYLLGAWASNSAGATEVIMGDANGTFLNVIGIGNISQNWAPPGFKASGGAGTNSNSTGFRAGLSWYYSY